MKDNQTTSHPSSGVEEKGSRQLLQNVVAFAKEKKATEIIAMDLRGISVICDYFLICTGANKRHVQSIADQIIEELKLRELPVLRIEGYSEGKWTLLDMGDLVVHIFQEDERSYYNLERLWGDAPSEIF